MFLLLLMGLGAASVKAQVRIGGNTPPNASAILDLNADGTNSGTKGLALPRVALTSNTMLLSGVTSNLTGMLVYNTSTTGGAGVNTIGIYYWNGATWIKASLPSTSAADSGKFLISNGNEFILSNMFASTHYSTADSIKASASNKPVTWTLIVDTSVLLDYIQPNTITTFYCAPVGAIDFCRARMATGLFLLWPTMLHNIRAVSFEPLPGPVNLQFQCYRPSF